MARVGLSVVGVLVLGACGGDGNDPPAIVSRTPEAGASNVFVGDPITVVFSEAIQDGATTVSLVDGAGSPVQVAASWSADRTTLTVTVGARPAAPGTMAITLTGVADDAGAVMEPETWQWDLPMWQQAGEALNVDPAKGAGAQRVAVDSQRRLVVVWHERDEIRVKRLTGSTWEDLGGALGTPGPANFPDVTVDGQDRPVVGWAITGTDPEAGTQVARWDGAEWTMLPSPGVGAGCALAADENGVVYVAHQAPDLLVGAGEVTVYRLTDADTWESLAGPFTLGGVGLPDGPPGIALAVARQSPVVVWSADVGAGAKELRSARFGAGSSSGWQVLPNLNRAAGSSARYPDLTIDATGRPVVAWEEYAGTSMDVHVAALTEGGTWQPLGRPLDVDLLDDARWPGLAAGADGSLFVAWAEFRGPVRRVWVASFSGAGQWEFVGGQALNREPTSFTGEPKLALVDKWPLVAWQEWQGNDNTASKVWVRRYNGNDVRLPGLANRPTTSACVFDPSSTTLLSQTGCFAVGDDPQPDPGLVPFEINSQLWSDGALKRRWIVLPDGETIDRTDVDGWSMPVGTMIVKEFSLEVVQDDPASRRPVETRFLVKDDAENNWSGFSFQWADDFSDASLLAGTDVATKDWTITTANGSSVVHTHTYPSRAQCLVCHVASAGVLLGIQSKQLNRFADYGGVVDQQLEAMDRIGLFSTPMAGLPGDAVARPSDVTLSFEARARGYLAANCGHCHRPGGARPTRDMRWETPLAATMLCIDSEIVPGDPASSVMYARATSRPGMPPIATLVVDPVAQTLLARWIGNMATCP